MLMDTVSQKNAHHYNILQTKVGVLIARSLKSSIQSISTDVLKHLATKKLIFLTTKDSALLVQIIPIQTQTPISIALPITHFVLPMKESIRLVNAKSAIVEISKTLRISRNA